MGESYDPDRPGAQPPTSDEAARFVVHALDTADRLVAAWRVLAAEAVTSNPFFRPGFALAAARHLAPDRVSIAAVEDRSGRLTALAPVVKMRLGHLTPALSVWAHDYGPLGAPLVDRAQAPAAMATLLAGIGERRSL
ncbi:MAG: hypothetical protein ACTSYE_05075, partial [Alphaproteobacteria bacterium]